MRYTLKDGILCPVKIVRYDGWKTSNPPDALVDSLGVGYALAEGTPPEYNVEIQYLTVSYALENNVIVPSWTVTNREIPEGGDDESLPTL